MLKTLFLGTFCVIFPLALAVVDFSPVLSERNALELSSMKNATVELPENLKDVADQLISLADQNNEECAKDRWNCIWKGAEILHNMTESDGQNVIDSLQNAGASATEQIKPKVDALVQQAIDEDVQAAQQEGGSEDEQ